MFRRKYKRELYVDDAGKWRWRLRARNGQIVATSHQSYFSKSNARRAVRRTSRVLA